MSAKSRQMAAEVGVGVLLTKALLRFPQLLADFPAMIASLDTGEYVNVAGISDAALREALTGVMQRLPLQCDPRHGWHKAPQVTSVGGVLLMELLQAGQIKQPSTLSEAESLASRAAPVHLLSLLQAFPTLLPAGELPALLARLLQGEAVQLDGLSPPELAVGLARFLEAAGVREGDDGLCVPDSTAAGVDKDYSDGSSDSEIGDRQGQGDAHVRRSLKLLRAAILLVGGGSAPVAPREQSSSSRRRRRRHKRSRSHDSSVDSSSGDEGKGDKEYIHDDKKQLAQARLHEAMRGSAETAVGVSGVAGGGIKDTGIGAAMPPGFTRRADEGGRAEEEDENEDEDDDVGPLPSWQAHARAKQSAAAAGVPGGARLAAVLSTDTPLSASSDGQEQQQHGPGREEWMLTPGDCAGAAMSALDNAFGRERKFASGKGAGRAAKLASSAATSRATAVPVDGAAAAVLAEIDVLRGPSLMDIHLEKTKALKGSGKGKGRSATGAGAGVGGFDYERDVGSFRQRVDSALRDQMVAEARQLDSRFDRSLK